MENDGTRQERRDARRQKRRKKMLQHGRGFIQAYKNAILKRAKELRRKGDT